ncbi:response regulator [Sphingomonas astaxanthinifaciens]|uniref:histidine kinase n=1 Tax=Sphingomonas astaxanthinifaciens DSM 22298 TaxID=1123267 RepID=A0ABQ5Z0T7_9SPHN|nr:response regulator [Sphingomonas astaxanthinifaciens]GLR46375.1 histidine kinase [Sphingomonas astaxanthinifaciens DSM 22298]
MSDASNGPANGGQSPRAIIKSAVALPRERQAAFMQMAELSSDLIALCDPDGKLLFLNPAGRRLIGIEDADIFPVHLSDYVAAAQRHLVFDEVVPTATRDGVWEGEMQLEERQSGQLVDVQRSTFACRDEDGTLTGFISVMHDITDRKRREAELAEQMEVFRSLIARNPFGVYLVDADFRLRVFSQGAEKVFAGIPDAIGRDFAEVIRILWPEPLATEVIERFRYTLDSGEPYESPLLEEARADVERRERYHWRIERSRMPDGGYGVVCYFYDLTDNEALRAELARREGNLRDLAAELEQRVRQRTAALNLANEKLIEEGQRREALQHSHAHSQKLEAIGQLTAGVAHDFNNLLGAVIGGLTLIENRLNDPRSQQIVKMSQAAADRGAILIRQLMEFARDRDLEPARVDVHGLFEEVVEFLQQSSRRGRHRIEIDTEVGIWPALVDRSQLQSALLNLANNARDAMPMGGRLTLRARNCPGDEKGRPAELMGMDAVLIEVIDDGQGMDGPTLQRVTEPFFTTKARGQGTGLGLAMVQRFVSQSRGALRIASKPGEGSTFGLYFPRADAGESARPARFDEGGTSEEQAFDAVLLVDDDDNLREILAAGLADRGFEVSTAATGVEALSLCRSRRFDVIVSDIEMPGMSGPELEATLRARGSTTPCLFMTGNTVESANSVSPILRKPFTPAQLQKAIRNLLAARGQQEMGEERLDRLAARLQSDCARSLFEHWRAIRHGRDMPDAMQFDAGQCSEPHRLIIAHVDLGKVPIEFDFEVIGDTLKAAFPGRIKASDMPIVGSDTPAAREAAYRRCALTGKPSFEYARFDLGEGEVETFERLLLPFSSDGRTVDRIVGAVVMEREPRGTK